MERSKRKRRVRRGRPALGDAEKRGLLQLGVCLVLFLTVFVGRDVFPDQTAQWRRELGQLLRQDTDFEAVFSHIGWAIAEEAPVLETLDEVWMEVFGARTEPLGHAEKTGREQAEQVLPVWSKIDWPEWTPPEPEAQPTALESELGLSESVTPVMGVLTSGFGMREHPIEGGEDMHRGIDLAAATGEEILAFSGGTVDYIGESEESGLYLQISHSDSVSTFYAHCSELCVQTGDQVSTGQVVAKVGSTGQSTGSHLHFALKRDGEHVDPTEYVEYIV